MLAALCMGCIAGPDAGGARRDVGVDINGILRSTIYALMLLLDRRRILSLQG